MDGSSYTINNTAEVLPKGNPNNSVSFIIPTVKDTKTVNIHGLVIECLQV